ncbi:MAG: response regulator receiver protein [Parcubacteria group bacterium Gr01-1014_72]|nr:MAG: response regulator receiver protein [Parcubacteria group bacterium Gr01-1014_72]
MKILIIEEEATVGTAIKALLEREGHTVSFEQNGKDGVERFTSDLFDTVITDFVMQGDMNGLDVARCIRAIDPKVRIILMSGGFLGGGNTELEYQAIKAGVDACLAKPFGLENLLKLLPTPPPPAQSV